ncbi:MAG: hypothetical protein IPL27_22695 [Lewinellaceae bacterium]|nr:hypothetical protein [Lewinellaceae bacterium]
MKIPKPLVPSQSIRYGRKKRVKVETRVLVKEFFKRPFKIGGALSKKLWSWYRWRILFWAIHSKPAASKTEFLEELDK